MVGTENKRIREAAKEAGLYLWQIAYAMGITDNEFSRRLRRQLPEEEEAKILFVIRQLSDQEGGL